MRKFFVIILLMAPVAGMAQAKAKKVKKPKFKDFNQTLSYAIGLNVAENFQMQGFELDPAMMAEGMKAYLANQKNAVFTDTQLDSIFNVYNQKATEYSNMKTAQEKLANEEAGKAFLAENGQREGVTTTSSGLQYEVITLGTGAKPTSASKVTVHYKGTLLDGTTFDSSYDRGEPATFPLNGVIAGWTEGLQYMPAGSKYKFYIPANLAYGDRGAGQNIKPGMTLVFEVELISIE